MSANLCNRAPQPRLPGGTATSGTTQKLDQADEKVVSLSARRRPWGDTEFRRFAFRVGLFGRRGWTTVEAEVLADRLALRDQDGDDRRVCLECSHLQQPGTCFAAQQGWLLPHTSRRTTPVRDLLQRCESFGWATP